MEIGVNYYPEQWDESLWKEDADRMQQAGVGLVRLAEFAWSRLEPVEGRYDFDWLDRIIHILEERGMQIVLGTPTCTPPLWLFEKYPETIQVDQRGHRLFTGIRGHRCLNSPVFRELARKMIRQMVLRYRDDPLVISYQIDNELETNHCCCPVCIQAFQQWIQKKYKTIEQVNQAYGNTVWSGEYSDFSQVQPPMGECPMWLNPSLRLDFCRYAAESTTDYVQLQADIIRDCDPDALITTNTWLCENMPDFYQTFATLDFVSYDNYPPTLLPEDPEEIYSHAFHLDLMRGIKQKSFWIMEQLSGAMGSWMPMAATPRPGMLKGYALQAIAHGADAVLHFRWRTGISGAEMYWHGILDHSNRPGRRYEEFCSLCDTVRKWSDALEGSVIVNQVALLYGVEQEAAFKLQHQAEGMYYLEALKQWHDAFTSIGVGVDIIDEFAELEAYQIVLAPYLLIVHEGIREKLEHFAAGGGTVLLTCRSGVKDLHNQCMMEALPTVWQELTGITVTEYDAIGSRRQRVQPTQGAFSDPLEEETCWCSRWCDLIQPMDDQTEVLLTYQDVFYQGQAALTCHPFGHGRAYYAGALFSRRLNRQIALRLATEQSLPFDATLPVGVERACRQKGDKSYLFYFNNTQKPQTVHQYTLQPFEMVIVEEDGNKTSSNDCI